MGHRKGHRERALGDSPAALSEREARGQGLGSLRTNLMSAPLEPSPLQALLNVCSELVIIYFQFHPFESLTQDNQLNR